MRRKSKRPSIPFVRSDWHFSNSVLCLTLAASNRSKGRNSFTKSSNQFCKRPEPGRPRLSARFKLHWHLGNTIGSRALPLCRFFGKSAELAVRNSADDQTRRSRRQNMHRPQPPRSPQHFLGIEDQARMLSSVIVGPFRAGEIPNSRTVATTPTPAVLSTELSSNERIRTRPLRSSEGNPKREKRSGRRCLTRSQGGYKEGKRMENPSRYRSRPGRTNRVIAGNATGEPDYRSAEIRCKKCPPRKLLALAGQVPVLVKVATGRRDCRAMGRCCKATKSRREHPVPGPILGAAGGVIVIESTTGTSSASPTKKNPSSFRHRETVGGRPCRGNAAGSTVSIGGCLVGLNQNSARDADFRYGLATDDLPAHGRFCPLRRSATVSGLPDVRCSNQDAPLGDG